MYKLLIVDDEKIVIEGLKSAVNWQEHQIEIVGSASDGEEALKEIMNKKPDIVLVDIRMPKLNGLDLIQETKALHLDTLFIIISGYSKFDYAKRAIQLEAVDYLVKPIEVEEIVHSIKKAMLKLEKIKNEQQATERMNEYQTALEEKRVLNSNRNETIPDIKKTYNEKLIIDLKNFILANYKEPIVLDDLGKLFHKNPAYLCSLFSKAEGNTIFEYITKVRLDNAKKLLRTTNLKVIEICRQVGYENQKYFNQVFKKNIGTTPGLYRSQHILK